MALAERGSVSNVSTTVDACKRELDEGSYFDNFPPEAVVHSFGNMLNPDCKGLLHYRSLNWRPFTVISHTCAAKWQGDLLTGDMLDDPIVIEIPSVCLSVALVFHA